MIAMPVLTADSEQTGGERRQSQTFLAQGNGADGHRTIEERGIY
jgi:hypothetical protein